MPRRTNIADRIAHSLVTTAFLLLGHKLTLIDGFSTTRTINRSQQTALNAVSLPLLDTYAGGDAWTRTTRNSRIENILEHARDHQRRREQRAINSPRTESKAKQSTGALDVDSIAENVRSLPFTLPTLTAAQIFALEEHGDIIMEQSEMGLQGSGFVVQDIPNVDEADVWKALLDFGRYTDMIHTVRSSRVRGIATAAGTVAPEGASYGVPSTTRASFDVSKFRLTISCIFQYKPQENYMELSLDNALQNSALQEAKGFWYTEQVKRRDGSTAVRVWLLCDLTLSPWLPKFVVDRAAASAMPRASTWLRPAVHAIARKQTIGTRQ